MGPAQPFIWGPRSELLAWNVIFFNKSSESKLQWSSHKGLLKNGPLDGELRACAQWLWLLFSTQGLKEEPPASCPAVHWGLMQDYWLRPSKWHSVREPGPSWEDKSQGLVAVRGCYLHRQRKTPEPPAGAQAGPHSWPGVRGSCPVGIYKCVPSLPPLSASLRRSNS